MLRWEEQDTIHSLSLGKGLLPLNSWISSMCSPQVLCPCFNLNAEPRVHSHPFPHWNTLLLWPQNWSFSYSSGKLNIFFFIGEIDNMSFRAIVIVPAFTVYTLPKFFFPWNFSSSSLWELDEIYGEKKNLSACKAIYTFDHKELYN